MIEYDPFSHATQEDPYPIYAVLRDRAPVHHNPGRDFHALSRHADVRAALRDTGRFSSAYGDSLDEGLWGPGARDIMSIVGMDAPEHTRTRALISAGFTPRRVAALEWEIGALARDQLRPFLERGEFDFAAAVMDIPAHVVSQLLGIPMEARGDLLRMSNLMINHRDESGKLPQEFWECAATAIAYFKDLIAERRREPRDDLASAMAQAEIDGVRLGDDEIVGVIGVLNAAGNESTSKLISNAWFQAWRHPGQRELAWAGAVGPWVEETLRYDGTAQLVARRLTETVELHGVKVAEGARVALLVASANRDERVFPDADRYDLTRDTTAALAFGTGPHFCLGAALARLTARVVLSELVARVSTYSIDAGRATYVHSASMRGFTSLPTRVNLR